MRSMHRRSGRATGAARAAGRLLTVLAVAVAGCGGAPPEGDDPAAGDPAGAVGAGRAAASDSLRLRTDDDAYTLRRGSMGLETTISFRYRNDGADTVYVVNCNRHVTMGIERRTVDGWSQVYQGASDACMSPPLVIAPGETFSDELEVAGLEPAAVEGSAGPYRLVWHQLRLHHNIEAGQIGEPLPLELIVSNGFTLGLPGS